MKLNSLKTALLLCLSCMSFNVFADFDELIVFGDSLSDTGNLASIPGSPIFPPFFYEQSRVSNGPVAVEGLAEKLGLSAEPSLHLDSILGIVGTNFAVAGATAGGVSPIDLETQVNAFLGHSNNVAPEDAVYVMFIGGNDVRDARDENKQVGRAMVKDAVDSVDRQLRRLIDAGAQHIFVVNAPDIGIIPETRLVAASTNNKQLVRRATALTKKFNRKLARKVRRIEKQTGLDLVLFDLFGHMEKMLENSVALGYSNTTDACFTGDGLQPFHLDCATAYGPDFSSFLFFDSIHPTGRSHERVSRAFYAEVNEPPVSE